MPVPIILRFPLSAVTAENTKMIIPKRTIKNGRIPPRNNLDKINKDPIINPIILNIPMLKLNYT